MILNAAQCDFVNGENVLKLDVRAMSQIKDLAKARINEYRHVKRDFMLFKALEEWLQQQGAQQTFTVEYPDNAYYQE